jgi:hypothetical protein
LGDKIDLQDSSNWWQKMEMLWFLSSRAAASFKIRRSAPDKILKRGKRNANSIFFAYDYGAKQRLYSKFDQAKRGKLLKRLSIKRANTRIIPC